MKSTCIAALLLVAAAWVALPQTPRRAVAPPKPRLVLAIVVDQFRYDYLVRFGDSYKGGLNTLLNRGAVFTNAYYDQYPTVTAVGHSTLLTGATPALSGIIENTWFDRPSGRTVTSVFDPNVKAVGGPGDGASPHRLMASTVCDQMKMARANTPLEKPTTKCFGVSLKDRSAILTNGHMADAAYWFDDGKWLTSTYYMNALPGWVADVNATNPGERYKGQGWRALNAPADSKPFVQLPNEINSRYWTALDSTPWGNELTLEFALRAVDAERLGQRAGETDVLAVSFSSNDVYGHAAGPDDPGVRDLSVRTDEQIGRLLAAVDRKVGLANTIVVFSADHGVAPTAEAQAARKMPGGRLSANVAGKAMDDALNARYGTTGTWIVANGGLFPYLNHTRIASEKRDLAEVRRLAADAVRALPIATSHIARVYTPEQILSGMGPADAIDRRVRNGYHPARSGDLIIVYEPYYYIGTGTGTTHGSPYSYDTHVPLIFMGPGINPGRYNAEVKVNDAAPTLATLLGVETPATATGRVLTEMLRP
jgi:predicted AlkP superfamily pyrophosphatase or phosphodiesterase